MKTRCLAFGAAVLLVVTMLSGCQTDSTPPGDRVHGQAGVQVKSHDTMGARPQPGT